MGCQDQVVPQQRAFGQAMEVESEKYYGSMNRLLTNARLGSVVGDVVQNAIPINSLHNTADDVTGTYAMAGYAADAMGREFVAIITVEQRDGTVAGIDVYDVTHAVSGRQKRSSRYTATSGREAQADTKSQGVYPIKYPSEISIQDLLSVVKDTYQSILSEDVLEHLGESRNPKGHYSDRVRYSLSENENTERPEKQYERAQSELKFEQPAWDDAFLRDRLGDDAYRRYKLWEKEERQREQKQRRAEQSAKAQKERTERRARVEKAISRAEETERKRAAERVKPTEAKKELKRAVRDIFGIPVGQRTEINKLLDGYAERILARGELTQEDRDALFDRLYETGVMTAPVDEYYSKSRAYLVKKRIYVNENTRAEFGDDWYAFKQRAFAAGVYLTKDKSDMGTDSWNTRLAEELPGLFDANEYDQGSMKAVEFSHWVNAQGYTADQAAVVKDELTYFNMTPASSSRYDKLVGSGMDPDDAYDLTEALNELQPEDGEDKVSDLKKWRASVDFSDDVDDQLAALSMVMSPAQFQKVEIANDFGVGPDTYVTLQEIKSQYDADGNNSYKNTEIQAAVDGLPGRYTRKQKAVLWQLATGSTSARNNPYSREIGQQVLDAKKAAKRAAAEEPKRKCLTTIRLSSHPKI